MKRSRRIPDPVRGLWTALPFSIAALSICATAGSRAGTEAVGTVAAIGLSVILQHTRASDLSAAWILPAAAAIGAVVALSSSTLTSEFLAAVAGLSLLYWVGASAGPRVGAGRPSSGGLLLPGASVALSLLVTQLLPGGGARLGVASALLVLILLAFAWAIRSDRSTSAPGAAPS